MTLLNIRHIKKEKRATNPLENLVELVTANLAMVDEKPLCNGNVLQHSFRQGNMTARIFYDNKDGALFPYYIEVQNRKNNWGYVSDRHPDATRTHSRKPILTPYTPKNISQKSMLILT